MFNAYAKTCNKLRQLFLLLVSIAVDFLIIIFSVFLMLSFSLHSFPQGFGALLYAILPVLLICLISVAIYAVLGVYSKLWEYAGVTELLLLGGAASASTFAAIFVFYITYAHTGDLFFQPQLTAFSSYLFVLFVMLCTYRFAMRFVITLHSANMREKEDGNRVMIVGAGAMGSAIIHLMHNSDYANGKPVLIVDDNRLKLHASLHNIPIRGGCAQIPELAEKYKIDQIIIAIPSATNEQFRRIVDYAMQTNCAVRSVPTLREITESGIALQGIKNIDVKDLLFREQANLYDDHLFEYVKGSTILVTGGGGSIGSEICRQAAAHKPAKIILFDIYENNAFELMCELRCQYPAIEIELRIGTVREPRRLDEVFSEFHPDIVFHAAAHKHVPLMEKSPKEAVKNNVLGTLNVAECARKYKVKRFVLLSTDKAVNPTNVMGATKRISELIIQHISACTTETCFAAVRFGNVLGSNGSVIPLFKRQIETGGPVTVTDPEVTRFFMTIPEAAQLVIKAGSMAKGGDIFVLDMGEPIKIADLARNVIRLAGFVPDRDIMIEYVGLRPGEKLYEELYQDEENDQRLTTADNKIFVLKPVALDADRFWEKLDRLRAACGKGNRAVFQALMELVPGFTPKDGLPEEMDETEEI